ncbi:MAG: cyclic nucleotide-binding domain-containing protein, partial [Actinomycetota bacterium]|nr:cyclic nucleotide-binding domain-containing protein [Actinomycetota bacterium]
MRSGRIARALGPVFANPQLRRIELAFAAFNAAEWGVWIAMLVYAYRHGGTLAAGLVALGQLVPSGLFAPIGGTLADRHPPARVLALGYVAQTMAMAATTVALIVSAPPLVAYALAALAASAVTITRPTQAALIPSLVRGIDELTGVNVVSGWIESLSLLVAPVLTGALLAVSGPAAVFAVMALAGAGAAILVAPLPGVARTGPSEAEPSSDPPRPQRALRQLATVARTVMRNRSARVLIFLLGAEFVLIGALDVLFVVLAVRVLGLGGAGAGYLNAAFGAGGVLGIAATIRMIGRARLAPPLAVAALVWAAAFVALGLWPTVLGAFGLLALAGAARTLLDVTVRTLLQRTVPADVLARVFGLIETLDSAGLAIGSMLAPALVGVLGPRAAIAGLAAIFPALLLLTGRALRHIDADADVPVVDIALLRSLAIFESVGAPVLEGLARASVSLEIGAGQCLIREGEAGDRYYAIADGTLAVTKGTELLRTVGRGHGVGEVALLVGVPRTATVTAQTPASLLAIDADQFMAVVTQHPASARVGGNLV